MGMRRVENGEAFSTRQAQATSLFEGPGVPQAWTSRRRNPNFRRAARLYRNFHFGTDESPAATPSESIPAADTAAYAPRNPPCRD
jgi:hypothetical protein